MIDVYDLEKNDKWDDIVKSFDDYDIYWLSGYVRAFQIHGDGEPLLLFYEDDSSRGINVVMKRDISDDNNFKTKIEKNAYYDVTTPYGYGGWHFEGNLSDINAFEKEYEMWCKDNNIVSEFVRFHPVMENASESYNDYYEKTFLGNTVAVELDSEEAIWERFSSSNRRHIKVSNKEGVEIRIETSKEAFDIFQEIYKTTMNQDDATSYYYFKEDFFESVRNDLAGNYKLFTAYLNGKPIASSIMLFDGKYMNYHLSGQLFEYRRYAGTNKLLYEAAKWGCEQGYEWLHLGGGLGAKEGPLYDFKKSFYKKGEDKEFFVGKKIVDKEKYDYLVLLRNDELSEGFFPRYRA